MKNNKEIKDEKMIMNWNKFINELPIVCEGINNIIGNKGNYNFFIKKNKIYNIILIKKYLKFEENNKKKILINII